MEKIVKASPFDTKKSIKKALENKMRSGQFSIKSSSHYYQWATKAERINVIRQGLSYDTIESISKKLNDPIKSVLSLVGLPQTTYNKRRKEQLKFDSRHSELIVLINELVEYGLDVFNKEEVKFQNWLKRPNLSFGGKPPISMLDTITGINEVKFGLNRLEFGNLA